MNTWCVAWATLGDMEIKIVPVTADSRWDAIVEALYETYDLAETSEFWDSEDPESWCWDNLELSVAVLEN